MQFLLKNAKGQKIPNDQEFPIFLSPVCADFWPLELTLSCLVIKFFSYFLSQPLTVPTLFALFRLFCPCRLLLPAQTFGVSY